MRPEIIGVICLIIVVGVSVLSPKLRLATPILLVLIGLGISVIPGVPPVHVPSEWILAGVLPPLLYSSAINLPLVDFRKNLGSISVLSVLLVIVSAVGTGFLLFMILPDLNLAGAIALGAVISPTDAVAATSIGKKLGLPPRLIAVLEGESLVNDASALVLLRTATAASAGTIALGGFGGVAVDFAYSSVVAIGVGLVVGVLTVWVRSRLNDSVLTTAVSFVIPFLAYIPAEAIGASGVLSVVVAGLYTGHMGAKHFTASVRISERLNWRTIQFLLENGVFLLMGLELKDIVVDAVGRDPQSQNLNAWEAIVLGIGAALVLFVIRLAFVGPLLAYQQARARRRDPSGPEATEATGWKGGLVLSWAGMRGVVTVAAAQSLPEATPYRSQLILIAFTVSIVTLLLQGGTLPWLIRVLKLRGVDEAADHAEFATLVDELRTAGLQVLESPELSLPTGERVDEGVVDRVRSDAELRSESAWERAHAAAVQGGDAESAPHEQYRVLRIEVLKAERAALLEARGRGEFASRILVRAQLMLDQEESRLLQSDGEGH
ncbi:sodium:proton antiporter [Herbiconiux sp. VKM Ac-1786]|uniref:cation:proton antiporter n=1 Tax=Herbiconiux sp. VKM Ac-1786 TaxID=2783824 RepID=UPI00188CE4ED|nr:sodium:proton antiporter [Herbiconiux sp. VKM Ac-1786]MBF4571046.1 sodium:proton antiporter [Herbiconiux sp. VKM Ac-1786]